MPDLARINSSSSKEQSAASAHQPSPISTTSMHGFALFFAYMQQPFSGFIFGTIFGYLLACSAPDSSGYVRSALEHLIYTAVLWSLVGLGGYVAYKTLVAGSPRDPSSSSMMSPLRELAKLQDFVSSFQSAPTPAPSTPFSARPYPHYADELAKKGRTASPKKPTSSPIKTKPEPVPRALSLPTEDRTRGNSTSSRRDSTQSSLSSSQDSATLSRIDSLSSQSSVSTTASGGKTRSKSNSSPPQRPRLRSIDSEQSFKPYDPPPHKSPPGFRSSFSFSPDSTIREDTSGHRSFSSSNIMSVKSASTGTATTSHRTREKKEMASVPATATRDPNRFSLVAAYIRPDRGTLPTKLSGKGLSLRITTEGLLLDDDAGSKGGDLKAWMIESIEYDISNNLVMRATTQTWPPIQVTYLFKESDCFKATLGLRALKRELQTRGIEVKEVNGSIILNDLDS